MSLCSAPRLCGTFFTAVFTAVVFVVSNIIYLLSCATLSRCHVATVLDVVTSSQRCHHKVTRVSPTGWMEGRKDRTDSATSDLGCGCEAVGL